MKRNLLFHLVLLLSILFLYADKTRPLKYEELINLSTQELIEKGNIFLQQSQIDTALMFYLVLSAKYNDQMDQSDQYLCALSCDKSAVIYYQKGNYSKAFDVLLKGIRICESNDFQDLLPELYKNIGNVYCVFQDFDRGNANYEKALTLSRARKDQDLEMKILNNLAGMYCYAGSTERAKYYYRQMKEKSRGSNNVLHEYFNLLDLGLIYDHEQKMDSAAYCYKASADYAIRLNLEPRYKSSSYFELAKLYEKKGDQDSALYFLHLNVKLTRENHLMDMLAESLKALARIHGSRGEQEIEQKYRGEYLVLSDSIFNLQELSRMKNAQFIYEMDQTRGQIETLNEEKAENESKIRIQQRILFGISAGLIIFLVMSVVVYIQKRKLRNAYKDLFDRSNEILKTEQQNKRSRLEYEEKLAEERLRNDRLAEKLKSHDPELKPGTEVSPGETAGTPDDEEQKEEPKSIYSANKLTEKQKKDLLKGISEVMENTEELCDCEFSLERLASLIGSNSRYVSQVINDTYGKNFRTFINEYRIRESQLRLLNTAEYGNYTIKAIAESVGYKSHTNFIVIFKKITGITPSMYQSIAKEKY